jgi:drug/metabolite transporter (DMT)-like permease
MESTLKITRLSSSSLIWISFIFLTIAWGSSFILVKRGLEAYEPAQVASIRLSSAMIALLGLAINHIKQVPRDRLPYIFLSGLFGLFIPAFMFAWAQRGVSSSIAGVLNAFTPCMTFILGIVFFRQKGSLMKILGIFLGFLGTTLLILINPKGQISFNSYAIFVIVATVCYGLNLNIVKRYLPEVRSLHLTSLTIAMTGLIAFLYLLSTDWITVYQAAPKGHSALAASVGLGLLGTAAGQLVFNRMLQMTSAVFASSITYFIPIVAVMWGVWDGEVLTIWHYLGMALIIGGVLILNKFK